jgi:acetoin utilization deacetylase AcuC-like enzyme
MKRAAACSHGDDVLVIAGEREREREGGDCYDFHQHGGGRLFLFASRKRSNTNHHHVGVCVRRTIPSLAALSSSSPSSSSPTETGDIGYCDREKNNNNRRQSNNKPLTTGLWSARQHPCPNPIPSPSVTTGTRTTSTRNKDDNDNDNGCSNDNDYINHGGDEDDAVVDSASSSICTTVRQQHVQQVDEHGNEHENGNELDEHHDEINDANVRLLPALDVHLHPSLGRSRSMSMSSPTTTITTRKEIMTIPSPLATRSSPKKPNNKPLLLIHNNNNSIHPTVVVVSADAEYLNEHHHQVPVVQEVNTINSSTNPSSVTVIRQQQQSSNSDSDLNSAPILLLVPTSKSKLEDDNGTDHSSVASLSLSSSLLLDLPIPITATTALVRAGTGTEAQAQVVKQQQQPQIRIVRRNISNSDIHSDRRTGLVFEHGSKHFNVHQRFHPERPKRIQAIRDHLSKPEVGLLARCILLHHSAGTAVTVTVPRPPTIAAMISSQARQFLEDDDYLRVHVPGYMARLDVLTTSTSTPTCSCTCRCQDQLDREASQYISIYLTPDSIREAKQAASSLCQLVENVVLVVVDNDNQTHSQSFDNGFAIIRPPGHHAEPSTMGGFCIINNIAVAAAYARAKLGVRRILIVDWDVHHGNGTQSMFYNKADIFYFSVHRRANNFYPFTKQGSPSHVGSGAGEGYNVNVGWSSSSASRGGNSGGMPGDAEYLAVWQTLLLPMAHQFQPDLILVSAGFDAAQGDMGECNVTPACFGALTRALLHIPVQMADHGDGINGNGNGNGGTPNHNKMAKVVCALEGGYNRSVLSKCVEHVIKALLEKGKDDEDEDKDCKHGSSSSSSLSFSAFIAREQLPPLGMVDMDADVNTDVSSSLSTTERILQCIQPRAAADIRKTMSYHSKYWKL